MRQLLRCIGLGLALGLAGGLAGAWGQGLAPAAAFLRPAPVADSARARQAAAARRARVRTQLPVPATGSRDYRRDYQEVVDYMAADVYRTIRYAALADTVLAPVVQRLFARLQRANPSLPPAQLVLTRNPEPNAYAVGDGTIFLNVGLLPRLENESQLAFVLCHELAHLSARHGLRGLHERLALLHSRALRQQVRQVARGPYRRTERLAALGLGLRLGRSYHARQFEQQADSLGYVLLRASGLAAPQAYRALQLLDQADAPETGAAPDLNRYFACAAHPHTFAGGSGGGSIFAPRAASVLELTDTLKTHPGCAKRMAFVRGLAGGAVAEGPQPAEAAFEQVRAQARLEVVQSWFDYDCYDHALFEALRLLGRQPRQPYLQALVPTILYGLHEHLQAHTLNAVLDNPDPDQPAEFRALLTTLYALRTSEVPGFAACFAGLAPAPAGADEYSLAGRVAAAALARDPAAEPARAEYRRRFPRGHFHELLLPAPPAPEVPAAVPAPRKP